ncbi:synaptotagmin-4 [Nerophis ophidion]|uniref:synaptotagmin-4 n=1 Tax=Nerophis ophidion TaxID=159077 RepID=UPI002AE01BB0|nr:synaptotagmin-4 [Nerophis ophidion]
MSQYVLAVHLQVLLAVLLAVVCYCLVLAVLLCCRRKKAPPSEDAEESGAFPRLGERVTVTLTPALCTRPVRQQYEELDGDVLDFTSSKSSSSPSEDDLSDLPFDPCPTRSVSLSPESLSPLRRLSSPVFPSGSRGSSSPSRASMPSLTKLVPKSRWTRGRRSTVSGETLATTQHGAPSPSQYGSTASSVPAKAARLLHFSLLYSASGTLVVNILGLSGAGRGRSSRVSVRASLPPVCPGPQRVVSRRRSLNPEMHSQSLVLQVGSVDELRGCTLRLDVYGRDFSGLREVALGAVELPCQHLDWNPDTTETCTRQLSPPKTKLKKSVSSQDTSSGRKPSLCTPSPWRPLGQLLVLLQYQSPARRIKVMVRKAQSLAKLTRIPGAPDHYVVINLHHGGKVIGTKETKGAAGSNPVWNAPFLFDLPPGNVAQLPMLLEFIVMQGRLYTKSSVLGRVLIGGHVLEAEQGHWKDMCSLEPAETAHWHTIQSEAQ